MVLQRQDYFTKRAYEVAMGIRTFARFTFLLGTILCLLACQKVVNPKERNRLVFTDQISSVADSIRVLNAMLLDTPRRHYIYAIQDGCLYVPDDQLNVEKVGQTSDTTLYRSRSLSFLDSADRKHFVRLLSFLDRNHLSRCDIEDGQPIYMYRADIYMSEMQTDLFRFVCLEGSMQEVDVHRYKILDEQDNLYLLANKEAKIWSDN